MNAEDIYYGLSDAVTRLRSAAEDLRASRRSEAVAVDGLIRDLERECDDLGARLDAADAAEREWDLRQYRRSV